jgi:hypothetical protein
MLWLLWLLRYLPNYAVIGMIRRHALVRRTHESARRASAGALVAFNIVAFAVYAAPIFDVV